MDSLTSEDLAARLLQTPALDVTAVSKLDNGVLPTPAANVPTAELESKQESAGG